MEQDIKAPADVFGLMGKILEQSPHLLRMGNYHTAAAGHEAMHRHSVEASDTAHCLVGWVVRLTPGAMAYEKQGAGGVGVDTLDLAQYVLAQGGHLPIPLGLIYGDADDALTFIRGRAAEAKRSEECLTA